MEVIRATVFLLCLTVIQATLLDLTCHQVRTIVDEHNARRLEIAKGSVPGQPAAERMTKLVWDRHLAHKARKWAEHNKFQHNPDKTLASTGMSVGENIYMFSTTNKNQKFDVKEAIKSWFDEVAHYKYSQLSAADFGRAPDQAIGHYTQMVWADTTKVGCGVSRFEDGGWVNFLVVCNYGPAGNIFGRYPYPKGKASNRLVCEGNCSAPYGKKCSKSGKKTSRTADEFNLLPW